jgi:hypothetical protein
MLPEPPVNVQLVLHDGSIIPVDTVYVGVVGGDHHWEVVNPPPPSRIKGMRIQQLPPQTAVTITTVERQ